MTTDRERFLMAMSHGPLVHADAIAVFLGEDAEQRLAVGFELMRTGASAVLYLAGGYEDPPRRRGAKAMTAKLLGQGVKPTAVFADDDAMNTWEQAVGLVTHALESEWSRVLLVASPYHLPRAFLTVIRALDAADAAEAIHVVPVAASQTPWWKPPAGMEYDRIELLAGEFEKCERYAEHVATWSQGLGYLFHWERELLKPEEPTDDAT